MTAPIVPTPRVPVAVRPAPAADLPFIDALQKAPARQVGWMPGTQLQQKEGEAMGFVPLAYRAGSRDGGPKGRGRVHIFWQRRVRAGDTTTPYWFPSQTTGGSIREARLVLPIPRGTHWADEMPVLLPTAASG